MTTGTSTIRTVSDGIRFKNQRIHKQRFLFWKWDVWRDLGNYKIGVWVVTYFDSIDDAKIEAKKSEDYYAKLHDWEPVP